MKTTTTSPVALASTAEMTAAVGEAWDAVGTSFEQFCLTAGLASISQMLEEDVTDLAGDRYGRSPGDPGYRWGSTKGKLGFHGGKVEIELQVLVGATHDVEEARRIDADLVDELFQGDELARSG